MCTCMHACVFCKFMFIVHFPVSFLSVHFLKSSFFWPNSKISCLIFLNIKDWLQHEFFILICKLQECCLYLAFSSRYINQSYLSFICSMSCGTKCKILKQYVPSFWQEVSVSYHLRQKQWITQYSWWSLDIFKHQHKYVIYVFIYLFVI